ncbi:MAG: ATP-binding protein [Bacteroidota bacterium]
MYETAMSIGQSLDLQLMLKKCLPTFLHKLNCTAGVIFRAKTDESTQVHLEQIFSIPRRLHNNQNFDIASKWLHENIRNHQDVCQKLPIIFPTPTGDFLHISMLADFGPILLIKNNKPIKQHLWQEMDAIFHKLGQSCIACDNSAILQDLVEEQSQQVRLSRKELIKARDQAQAATKAKSQFLSTMTHELRTPMNGVIGMTALLAETKLNDEQEGMLEIIQSSGSMLLAIINDILDFSKMEAGKLELDPIRFKMERLVTESLAMVAEKSRGKGLKLGHHISKSVPDWLVIDPVRLRQVLGNLLSNAIKFTDQGSVHLAVEAKEDKGGRFKVVFTVMDTGIGIPKERLNRLFQSFSQVDASTARKYGGTGLGLAISKNLAELMGGTMWVESEEGKGSSFSFSIMATRPDQEGEKNDLPKSTSDFDDSLSSRIPLRILLVDDHPFNRIVGKKMLRNFGYVISMATNGKEAIQLTAKETFDLIFMDINMPKMDGMEASQYIRQHHGPSQRACIVALTANTSSEDTQRYLNSGMDLHIRKPIEVKQLKDVLLSFAITPESNA